MTIPAAVYTDLILLMMSSKLPGNNKLIEISETCWLMLYGSEETLLKSILK